MEQTFTDIYDKKKWGKGSGTGSKMSRNNQKYIDTLKRIINTYDIKSICDIGCGDWQFSQFIGYDNMDVSYLGIDCVKSVVDEIKQKYQTDTIKFEHRVIGELYIPKGYDLIVLKDVIQHWTDQDILKYLPDIIKHNKYVFLTNGYKFMRDPKKNEIKTRNIQNQYRYHPVSIDKYPLSEFKSNCIETTEYFSKQMNLLKH
jgi:2-polyprenyl-3-methyl-5-hydroxy-6-metoxy-1,4-benzoquinol methylase